MLACARVEKTPPPCTKNNLTESSLVGKECVWVRRKTSHNSARAKPETVWDPSKN